MGKRGPKPGWKKAAAPAKVAAAKPAAQPPRAASTPTAAEKPALVVPAVKKAKKKPMTMADVALMPVAHRENPEKLSDEPLRLLAHRRGLSRSSVDAMSDEKIREQLRYLAYRQYDEAA